MLFWNIRYLDRTDRKSKNRRLVLQTETLDSAMRAAIEFVAENRSSKTDREIVKYRHLFLESDPESGYGDLDGVGRILCVGPHRYYEDQTGAEISADELIQILTNDPDAQARPPGAKQYDVDLMLSDPRPVPIAEVTLDPEEVRILGYFVRDLRELCDSAFMQDSPGAIDLDDYSLETAASDEEIRSFVTIFRRLYMTGKHDPASFVKAVAVFIKALDDHPFATWVACIKKEYESHLESIPDIFPLSQSHALTFTTKRLIDVFLYTQYAHQPDDRRQRQFEECLDECYGKRTVLTWIFLSEIWKLSIEVGNAGKLIAWWFKHYCDHHGLTPDILNSLRDDHFGLGDTEKEKDRAARLFREKAEDLAMELWKKNGRPEGGPTQFLASARAQLAEVLQN